jgi:ABC-2 type transport system permease protein
MLYCLFRGALAMAAAIAVAYAYGFRMTGGFVYAAAFVAVALLLTLALSLGADATGCLGWKLDAASQLLLVPQLLLVLLSTGMAPADAFPDWLEPFVRQQPVSQVTETLRGFADGHLVGSNLAASLAWCVGLLVVFGAIALRMQRRTQ